MSWTVCYDDNYFIYFNDKKIINNFYKNADLKRANQGFGSTRLQKLIHPRVMKTRKIITIRIPINGLFILKIKNF